MTNRDILAEIKDIEARAASHGARGTEARALGFAQLFLSYLNDIDVMTLTKPMPDQDGLPVYQHLAREIAAEPKGTALQIVKDASNKGAYNKNAIAVFVELVERYRSALQYIAANSPSAEGHRYQVPQLTEEQLQKLVAQQAAHAAEVGPQGPDAATDGAAISAALKSHAETNLPDYPESADTLLAQYGRLIEAAHEPSPQFVDALSGALTRELVAGNMEPLTAFCKAHGAKNPIAERVRAAASAQFANAGTPALTVDAGGAMTEGTAKTQEGPEAARG